MPTSGTLNNREIARLGLFIGLAAGWAEVAMRAFQQFVLGDSIHISSHYVWMIPVAQSCLFLVITAFLVLGRKLAPVLARTEVVLGVFIVFAIAGPILALGRFHEWALLALTIGIASAAARTLAPKLPGISRAARALTPSLAGLTVLAPAAFAATLEFRERAAVARLAPADADAPNVLFIILDTVRAPSLSLYGYELPTSPNLERFARDAVVFRNAWSVSPWTLPSHGSLFTGQYEHRLSTSLTTPLDTTYPTLAEHFRDRGYRTAGFAANVLFTTKESGLARGFDHYDDYVVSPALVIQSCLIVRRITAHVRRWLDRDQMLVRWNGRDVTNTFIDWVGADRDRPFFAFLNFFDVHAPYLPPDSLYSRFGPHRTGPAHHDLSARNDWTPEELHQETAAYDAMIAWLDAQLGRLFATLDTMELTDNTFVILTADHGEQIGEHGIMDHGNSLYATLLHVPLVMRFPHASNRGTDVATPVSLRDIAATIVDVTGQTPAPFPGVSLAALARGDVSATSALFSEVRAGVRPSPWLPLAKGAMSSIVDDGHHYILNGDGREELYDLGADPAELHDLASDPDSADRLIRFRAMLERLRADEPATVSMRQTGR